LPPQPTRLLGREAEIAWLCERLLEPEVRLLTLTGPGGTGKTRLAIALAGALLDPFGGDVCFVDLASIDTPERVLSHVAQTLGVYESGGLPPAEGLQRALHDRQLLLVLDSFEHVLSAAGELAWLLEICPRIKLLVTSREPLLLRWEREVPVSPLELPVPCQARDPVGAMQAPAIALFVQRAQDIDPDFRLSALNVAAVSELCGRLDGLPLAIELAAARLRVLPPAALLDRLGQRLDLLRRDGADVPSRHRTLAAAIGWSYELLTSREQRLFRRFGAFAGGATLEAVEAVAEGGLELLASMSALVEKSLVQRVAGPGPGPRFRLLETVRMFAFAELVRTGEAAEAQRRHACYFLELAERAEAGILGSEQMAWFARLEPELSNFRAALRWTIDVQDAELARRLGSALMAFWFPRGHFIEARSWLTEVLSIGGADVSTALVKTLARLGALIAFQGDAPRGSAMTGEAMQLAERLGDPYILGQVAQGRGIAALAGADLPTARANFGLARTSMRAVGNWFWEAFAEDYLGLVAAHEGKLVEAADLTASSLARRRAGGDRWGEAESLERLGLLNLRQGAVAAAHQHLCASLLLRQRVEDKLGLARGLESLAVVAAHDGMLERAAMLLGAGDALRDALGAIVLPLERGVRKTALESIRAGLGHLELAGALAAGRGLPLAEAIELATTSRASVPSRTQADQSPPSDALTLRERQVAALIAQGRTSHEIAELLVISKKTADVHVDHIRGKLGMRSRAEIAAWAAARGLG
jgi:non-specific serine/threonine protein kinase